MYGLFPQTQKGCIQGNILYEHAWVNDEDETINDDTNTIQPCISFIGSCMWQSSAPWAQKSIRDFMLDDFAASLNPCAWGTECTVTASNQYCNCWWHWERQQGLEQQEIWYFLFYDRASCTLNIFSAASGGVSMSVECGGWGPGCEPQTPVLQDKSNNHWATVLPIMHKEESVP